MKSLSSVLMLLGQFLGDEAQSGSIAITVSGAHVHQPIAVVLVVGIKVTVGKQLHMGVPCGVADHHQWDTQRLAEVLDHDGSSSRSRDAVVGTHRSAFVNEQITENDEALPEWLEGLVNVFEQTKVSVRKAAHR